MNINAPFYFDYGRFAALLTGLRERTPENIVSAGSELAAYMCDRAKKDAPWSDRTGLARSTIGYISQFGEENTYEHNLYAIGVFGAQPYSPHLETGLRLRYAVLMPTLRKFEPTILETIRSALSRQEGID